MKNFMKVFLSLSAMFLFVSTSYATPYLPESYESASHDTAKWQNLGEENDTYGVYWRVDENDEWGHDELFVGQEIQFQIVMGKACVGNHFLDLQKTWVDWDGDGFFNNTTDVIAFDYYVNQEDPIDSPWGNENISKRRWWPWWNKYKVNYYDDDTHKPSIDPYNYFINTTGFYKIENEGELFLRSRVTCSESLITGAYPDERRGVQTLGSKWDQQWNIAPDDYNNMFLSTGNYYQGEVEEWRIKVHAAPVPEPSTIFLLGVGLISLAGFAQKKKG